MPNKVFEIHNLRGISHRQVAELQRKYGKNIFHFAKENRFARILLDTFREPMFIMLTIACSLYFILGEINEGIIMACAIGIVAAISLYQEVKSSNAIRALKQFTEPKITVIRDGEEKQIDSVDLVPGDAILVEEGMKIPADAIVLQENDLTIDESVITGESLPVDKSIERNHNMLFQGCTVNSGKGIARVTAIGNRTALGKIGKSISGYNPPKTLLQVQMNRFVRKLALFGLIAFVVIFFINFQRNAEFATSLLFALTLAMSSVPEELPVAFSTFMALGAYKMSKLGIITRQPQIIENLGAVSVICFDKTGTITENRMQVKAIYDYTHDEIIDLIPGSLLPDSIKRVLKYGILASEKQPFDTMEKAIHKAYSDFAKDSEYEQMKMVYEYPLEGNPPMMTHVYNQDGTKMVAGKGAAERILSVCRLNKVEKQKITDQLYQLASKGYRVLGVASAIHNTQEMPIQQDDFNWEFEGLLALYDPPKPNIPAVLKKINDAQIHVKLVTGDYPATAITIAEQAGILNPSKYYTGEQVMKMNFDALETAVHTTTVFARMFPDAKLKLINAIKANGDIVAMTGDGVNDGPALKASHIGIAMGKKGTDTAKQASDLILTDDNLEKIVLAISEGRKIYNNLLKAIRYIISIHIPIILTASIPLILGWHFPNIFTPIHVIFLELIMGPTCSIFFEREPVEKSIMQAGPRDSRQGLFTLEELLISIVQGLIITAGVLGVYYWYMTSHHSIEETRTMVFTTIILSNVFLTFASRSYTKTIYHTIRYKNYLAPLIILVSAIFLGLLHFSEQVQRIFQLATVTSLDFWICFSAAFVSVMWFEAYKLNLGK